MELFLQAGHGMMGMIRELIGAWGGAGAILSPRDLQPGQLARIATEILESHGEALIDPQCFVHDADHRRLVSHEYFKVFKSQKTSDLLGQASASAVLSELAKLSRGVGVKRHILPGLLAKEVAEPWFVFHENMIREAPKHFGGDPLLATIALSSEVIMDEASVENIVDRASKWPVQGYYLVAEAPSKYLVDHPVWLADLLILASGLKLTGKTVIVGYSSHQMLCLASANIDAIASGNFLNVRNFPVEKFYNGDDEDISRRATWYYCPHALSEYKIPALDLAQRQGILQELKAAKEFNSSYGDTLFSGPDPSVVGWGETEAFKHYLACLRSQALSARKSTFDETLDEHNRVLDVAERAIARFRKAGVFGGDREFREYIEVNRGALILFAEARGPRLRRNW